MSEATLMRQIQLRASEMGVRLFRNNVGLYKRGPRVIRYGLCVGSSDLIGWNPAGRFIAVEVKLTTSTTKEQMQFLQAVVISAGIGIIAHSVQEFEEAYHNQTRIL